GFTMEERQAMTALLEAGFTDTFRYLYPEEEGKYSWWSYMNKARDRNIGWRIDYFIISNRIAHTIQKAEIHDDILGSDHCPVLLQLKESE
ncbi:MAG: exodeoxyribonuclease III, partial [Kurthia sp.]|nr:exodeoxyribonuclease III [Kurthia sp.]